MRRLFSRWRRWVGTVDRQVAEAHEALRKSRAELRKAMVQRTEASATAGDLKALQEDTDHLAAAVRRVFGGE